MEQQVKLRTEKIKLITQVVMLTTAIVALIGGGIAHLRTQNAIERTQSVTERTAQNETVEFLALHFDVIDTNLSYEEALAAIYEEYNRLTNENIQLTSEVSELESDVEIFESKVASLESEIEVLERENESLRDELDTVNVYLAVEDPNDEEVINAEQPISIRNITSVADDLHDVTINSDNFQNEHLDVVAFRNPASILNTNTFYALLDNRYTRLRGTLFIAYGESLDGMTTLRFELDGRVSESHVMGRTTRPISIDIDLSNVNEFVIIMQSDGWRSPMVYFSDFRFYP